MRLLKIKVLSPLTPQALYPTWVHLPALHTSPSTVGITSFTPMTDPYCTGSLMLSFPKSLICLASSWGLCRQGSQGFFLQRLSKCQRHLCTALLLGRCHCEGNSVKNQGRKHTALGDGMFEGIDLSARVFVQAQSEGGWRNSSNSPISNSSSHFNL